MNKKETKDIRIQMVMSESQKRAIDNWRSKQEDLPSRSEAIRRLISTGLEVSDK